MQSLVEVQYIQEARDSYMQQYLLRRKGMLSTTGYKVLQGQEAAGLIPCVRVIYDYLDKLDYDIERYQDLATLLPELEPKEFLHYVNGVIAVILNLRSVGFLHPCNLETSLDKIFVDTSNNTVHLIYLPVDDSYLKHMNNQYEKALKAALLTAIKENNHWENAAVEALSKQLADPSATLERIQASLAGLEPLNPPPPGAPTGTMALSTTDEMQSGALQSSGLGQPAPVAEAPEPPSPPPSEESVPQKEKKPFRTLFKPKPRSEHQPVWEEVGGTEVLAMFVPSIYLKGPDKDEYLVDKQEYVLGRDKTADGTIELGSVSRKHCKITHSDSRNFVTDLGSANGTYLNGEKLEADKPRPLGEGDKLKLGHKTFVVVNV